MRRVAGLTAYALAAACWLAAGPGGATVDALIACRHHQAHHAHGGHAGAPSNGPCFCGEMTGGSDLVMSPAVPAALVARPVMAVVLRCASYPAPFPLPPSPSFAPESPPPNALA